MSLSGIYAKKIKKYIVIESLPEGMAIIGTPQFTYKRGSFTVEAAIILPLLAVFFSFLLFLFQIMQIQLEVQTALEETGRKLAILSAREIEDAENGIAEIIYLPLAKTEIYTELQNVEQIEQFVKGGAFGISLLASEFSGDYIELVASYNIRFPLRLLGRWNFFINQRACFRKWTGWHAVDVNYDGDVSVYMTPNGEVYHMRRSCPYLTLSIREVKLTQLQELRNKDGKIYRECKNCKKEVTIRNEVFITDYGEKYHFDRNCSGLKRTIYQKKLSEVKEMEPCMKCSK